VFSTTLLLLLLPYVGGFAGSWHMPAGETVRLHCVMDCAIGLMRVDVSMTFTIQGKLLPRHCSAQNHLRVGLPLREADSRRSADCRCKHRGCNHFLGFLVHLSPPQNAAAAAFVSMYVIFTPLCHMLCMHGIHGCTAQAATTSLESILVIYWSCRFMVMHLAPHASYQHPTSATATQVQLLPC
jgi:hypothetical protein